MRNLKKILALVMALVMSLSLVTIANASDFTDSDDITYEEAADVMSAIGIIEGFEDGSFDPDGTLTREQAAMLVARMLLGTNADRLGIEDSTFNDVAVTRWSAPAIEYCVSLGLIDGAGDGNFYPAGQLTGYAFAKILLTAIGYSSEAEGLTGNSDADAMLLKCARAILRHRSGTGSEDLYLVSTVDGSVKGYQTASRTPLSVEENASIARAVSERPAGTLFAIHNHPTNVPPTGSDFVASGRRGYAGGVVVLHDGGIYAYRHGDKPFSASAFDMTVERYRKKGNIDKKAFELAMRDFEGRFGITWRRIR